MTNKVLIYLCKHYIPRIVNLEENVFKAVGLVINLETTTNYLSGFVPEGKNSV